MKIYCTIFAACWLLCPGIAAAQLFVGKHEEINGKQRYVMQSDLTVTPQKPPEPALKYSLHWGFDQRVRANAAAKYNMAMRELLWVRFRLLDEMAEEQGRELNRVLTDPEFFKTKKDEHDAFEKRLAAIPDDAEVSADQIRREASLYYRSNGYSNDSNLPRDKFPMEEARQFLGRFQNTWRLLEEGSRYDYCDWEYRIRGNRNPISIQLQEIQECRDLARALQVKCRMEIFEGHFEHAVQTLRVGKTMARHVNETPLMVASLAGTAIDGVMTACLMEFVGEPNAPNLYWTLTAMPSPHFDVAGAFEVEMDFLRLMFPELVKAMDQSDEMSDEEWKSLDRSCRAAMEVLDEEFVRNGNPVKMQFSGLVAYPQARKWLLEQGRTETDVEAMPTSKVIGLWSVYRYKMHRDNMRKVFALPYWEMLRYKNEYEPKISEAEKSTPLGSLFNLVFPSVGAYRNALTRQAANHETFRLIEAIRLHAAENDGKLPEKLDDIRSVPVPVNPYTGKPFDYKIVDGAVVTEFDCGWGIYRTVIRLR